MVSLTDPAFQAWLSKLPDLGYPPTWISNNLPALQSRFQQFGAAQMPECPPASVRVRDRYEEI